MERIKLLVIDPASPRHGQFGEVEDIVSDNYGTTVYLTFADLKPEDEAEAFAPGDLLNVWELMQAAAAVVKQSDDEFPCSVPWLAIRNLEAALGGAR